MNRSREWGPQAFRHANGNRQGFPHEALAGVPWKDGHASSHTILFVDDDTEVLTVRRLIFEILGYFVLTADSGNKALEALQSHAVDAVVLDYPMPGMDGEETIRRIRGIRANVPIILSSACLSVPQRVLAIVNASVNKGMLPEVLLEVLQQQLRHAA